MQCKKIHFEEEEAVFLQIYIKYILKKKKKLKLDRNFKRLIYNLKTKSGVRPSCWRESSFV